MRRCLLVACGSAVVIVATTVGPGAVGAYAMSAPSGATVPTSYLCQYPVSVTAAGHTVSTPEVCVPFIQWPPAAD
jgi:hypothetical protein